MRRILHAVKGEAITLYVVNQIHVLGSEYYHLQTLKLYHFPSYTDTCPAAGPHPSPQACHHHEVSIRTPRIA